MGNHNKHDERNHDHHDDHDHPDHDHDHDHGHDRDDDNPFGPVIHSYTRREAIDDGVLIDVSETAREAGIIFPTAVTMAVWEQVIAVPESVPWQSERGRLWDVVWMFRMAVQRSPEDVETLLYKLFVQDDEKPPKEVTLKAVCGPGDRGEPVITIMLPDEN